MKNFSASFLVSLLIGVASALPQIPDISPLISSTGGSTGSALAIGDSQPPNAGGDGADNPPAPVSTGTSSSDNGSSMDKFLLTYMEFVEDLLGIRASSSNYSDRIMLLPPNTPGIRAGKTVPQPVTNNDLFSWANVLQDPSKGPLFSVNGPSYCDSLADYLSNIAVDTKTPSRRQLEELGELRNRSGVARDAYWQAYLAAQTEYAIVFLLQQWYPRFEDYAASLPGLAQQKQEWENAAGAYWARYNQVYGSEAGDVLKKYNNLKEKALVESISFPGYNMQTYSGDFTNEIEPWVERTLSPDKLQSIVYKALYETTGLEEQSNAWFSGQNFQRTTLKFKFTQQQRRNWSSFGYYSSSRTSSILGGFLTTTANATNITANNELITAEIARSASIEISFFGAVMPFSFRAGKWDVPGVREAYPTLQSSKRDLLKGMYRPSRVVMGYKPRVKVEFSSKDAWRRVSSAFEYLKSVSGAKLSIVGFEFDAQSWRNGSDVVLRETENGGEIETAETADGLPVALAVLVSRIPGSD